MSATTEISPGRLASRLRAGDEIPYLLDVRRRDEYQEWHIDGTHNVPVYDQLLDEDLTGFKGSLDEIPADEEVVIVCVAGVTSAFAADFLRDRGYDAKTLEDGMRGWGRLHVPFRLEAVDDLVQVLRPGTGCISYLVHDGGEAVVVDPSLYVEEYQAIAAEHQVEITSVVDTHAHADHLSGGRRLATDLDIPYYLHPADATALGAGAYAPIQDGDTIPVGDERLTVYHTPGHTPGSVSITWNDALLSGDTLFVRSVGRPDLEGSDETDIRRAAAQLFESLTHVVSLSDETVVVPGHVSNGGIHPVRTTVSQLEAENELFGMEREGAFVETILESLSDEPANYNQIKAINWGLEPLTEESVDLELGPNNCAAN